MQAREQHVGDVWTSSTASVGNLKATALSRHDHRHINSLSMNCRSRNHQIEELEPTDGETEFEAPPMSWPRLAHNDIGVHLHPHTLLVLNVEVVVMSTRRG